MNNVVFTDHAKHACEQRAIRQEWVERTIREPDTLEPDRHHDGALNALKIIHEHGGRTLRVVYVERDEMLRVITAFFDRRIRR